MTLTAKARRQGDHIIVETTIVNDKTGHHVPTDSPLRQMILLVTATDTRGTALKFHEGPILPDYAGAGDSSHGCYAGLPGKAYAKILMELWTEITPTGAYWNPTRLVSDTRLRAFGSDVVTFIFAAPPEGPATIEISLLYRRSFITLVQQKGWHVPDIVMAKETILLP